MFELQTVLLFIVATLAINLSPGPSILYISSVAASRGIQPALISVAGMSVGIAVHVVAAATGLATILATSAAAFTIIKYIGAAYLIFLGVKTLLQPASRSELLVEGSSEKLRTYFYRGILVDLLNPKIALFFLAFMPQFIVGDVGGTFAKSIILGILFIVIGGVVNSCIALALVKSINKVRFRTNAWIERWIPGAVLTALGARLAYQEV